jgi:hypothetical protein
MSMMRMIHPDMVEVDAHVAVVMDLVVVTEVACGAVQPASEIPSQDCMHGQEEADNNAQFLVNNLEEVKDYMDFSYDMYSKSYAVDIDTLQANVVTFQLNESTLLLESCSTLNLLADSAQVDNIHEVDKTMHVRCNVGIKKMNLMGQFGDFPEPVWYNPDSVATILLLYIMSH